MGDLDEFGPEIPAPKPLAAARKRLTWYEKKGKPKPRKRRTKEAKKERQARTAPARQAAREKHEKTKLVSVELTMPHSINGIIYGPGVVKVTQDLAQVFAENERRVRENDALMFGGGRAQFIGPQGKRIPVPYDSMNSPAMNMIEAFSL